MNFKAEGLDCTFDFSQPDDEGWIRTSVSVTIPCFQGKFICSILKSEWIDFNNKLHNLESSIGIDSEISWSNCEQNIDFKLKLHKNGKIDGQFRFSTDNFEKGPTLIAPFEADQTYLKIWIKEAEEINTYFR